MTTTEVRRPRELEAENARLKRLLAERDLEIDAIKDVLRGK
jgi:putative transposase